MEQFGFHAGFYMIKRHMMLSLIKDATLESYEMKCIPEQTKNIYDKKYLLKRYLPIVPDPFFEFVHFSLIIKATLSLIMHFFEIIPVLPQ